MQSTAGGAWVVGKQAVQRPSRSTGSPPLLYTVPNTSVYAVPACILHPATMCWTLLVWGGLTDELVDNNKVYCILKLASVYLLDNLHPFYREYINISENRK